VKILYLHHILLPVADIEVSAAFYEKMGMERIQSLSDRIAWMQFGPNQLHLWRSDELHAYNGWQQEPSPHFAIEADDIFEFLREIPNIGGTILQEPKRRPHNNSWYLFALDPDGNRFEVMQSTNLD
jgi:catechol 2,3-dioxygenase-like lactoylglutathione lyase family enzyme